MTLLNQIAHIISSISPLDDLETRHIQETLDWIQSGAPLFRTKKPDVPNKHLVSYFVIFDQSTQKILLVDHKKSGLWLPPGGHVDLNEHPTTTVMRECQEELGIEAQFWNEMPLFITSTLTVGITAGHTDVSLWYVLNGNENDCYSYDIEEFHAIRWFRFDQIPYASSDPHLPRFIKKLKKLDPNGLSSLK